MKRLNAPTVFSLLALSLVAAAPAIAQDDPGDKDRQRLVVERLGRGDCLSAIHLGAGGPALLSLGPHAYLGVELTALTPELRRHFGAPDDAGVLIGRVDDGSPAAAAGLQVGDVVTRFDGEDVTSGGRLGQLVRQRDKDDQVTLEYFRDGKPATTTATLGERRRCGFDVSGLVELDELPGLEGMQFLKKAEGEDWGEAKRRLREVFESQDWESQLQRLQEIDVDGIEERLREAMERLHELEEEIRNTREKVEDDASNL